MSTRREEPHEPAGTRRDNATSARPTRRDGDGLSDERPSAGAWIPLPGDFSERFRLVKELRHGAEAMVLLVADGEDRHWVLKRYHQGIQLDEDALRVLSGEAVDLEHVVQIEGFGQFDDGTFYEIQEWCPSGSLRRFVDSQGLAFEDVVRQLAGALRHVHSLGIVHRDIKPENILVRSVEPLDLVLADFGLVRRVRGSVRRTSRAGTVEYSPPEGITEQVDISPAWDWWSLGMLLAELGAGVHPLALPDGSFPSIEDTRLELAQHRVDLNHVGDSRHRLLCQGLLTRDRNRRWGAAEVDAWLAGESPDVDDTSPPSGNETSRATRTVLFAGQELSTPSELAAAFQRHWHDALQQLFQERDAALLDETVSMCRATGRSAAISTLEERSVGTQIVPRFAQLLVDLDPDLAPTFEGVELTPSGLERAANTVLARSDPSVVHTLATVQQHQILRRWRHLPGMSEASGIEHQWVEMTGEARALAQGCEIDSSVMDDAVAWLLLVAVDSRHGDDLRSRVTQIDQTLPSETAWWRTLLETDTISALALAYLTSASAAGQAAAERERVEQQRRAEQARLADEQRQALERAQAQQARERAEAAQARQAATRNAFTDVALVVVWPILLLLPLSVLGAFGDPPYYGSVAENLRTLPWVFGGPAIATAAVAVVVNLRWAESGRLHRALEGWEWVPAIAVGLGVLSLLAALTVGTILGSDAPDPQSRGSLVSPLTLIPPALVPALWLLFEAADDSPRGASPPGWMFTSLFGVSTLSILINGLS